MVCQVDPSEMTDTHVERIGVGILLHHPSLYVLLYVSKYLFRACLMIDTDLDFMYIT